jgi:heme/copper-type cytochrome/quinol oxidase subunit 1
VAVNATQIESTSSAASAVHSLSSRISVNTQLRLPLFLWHLLLLLHLLLLPLLLRADAR